MQKYGELV